MASWASVENSSLAPFFRNSDLWLCVQHYGARNITRDLTFTLAKESAEQCIQLQADQAAGKFGVDGGQSLHSQLACYGEAGYRVLETIFLIIKVLFVGFI